MTLKVWLETHMCSKDRSLTTKCSLVSYRKHVYSKEENKNKPRNEHKTLNIKLIWRNLNYLISQSAGAVEYTDCFSAEE